MNLPGAAIKRPIATLIAVLLAVILGAVSLTRLTVDLLPDITFPVTVVIARYPGASPYEVESMVTRQIEEAVGSVSNIRRVRSTSAEELSVVIAELNWGTDMDFAALEMRERVDQIQRFLPADSEAPMIIKLDPAMMPVLQLSMSGGHDLPALTGMAEDVVKGRLERLDGVASVDVIGGQRPEIQVEVQTERLPAYGLDLSQIVQALRMENLSLPGGRITDGGRRLLVRSVGEFTSVEDIAAITIVTPLGTSVELGEVAVVTRGLTAEDHRARLGGVPSIALSIQKRPDANTVQVASHVLAEMSVLADDLPDDVEFAVAFDNASFISSAITGVLGNAALGALLAVIILFMFLQSVRTTLVIGIAIPISVITTLALVYLAGLTVNLMSLGGLALGIGMMVDTAIVVLENIFRHRKQGMDAVSAAEAGTNEVIGAVVAAILTTIGVFVPVVFLSGMASELFRELAVTVSFALAASLVVSVTVVPVLASRLFAGPTGPPRNPVLKWWGELVEDRLKRGYSRILTAALDHRVPAIVLTAALLGGSLLLIPRIGSEFMPEMDSGEFMVNIELPTGTTLDDTDAAVRQVEELLLADHRIERVFATVGSGAGMFSLGGGADRDRGTVQATMTGRAGQREPVQDIVAELRPVLADIPGARIDVEVYSGFIQALSEDPLRVMVRGDDLEVLKVITDDVANALAGVDGVRGVEQQAEQAQPELRITVDRMRASFHGITAAQIGTTVRTAIQGDIATRLKTGGREIDIRVKADDKNTVDVHALGQLSMMSRHGYAVRLSELATLSTDYGPVAIEREDQVRVSTVTAQISGRSLGEVSVDAEAVLNEISLPPGYTLELGGERGQMMDTFDTLNTAAILAVILVYCILAAQFESLTYPLVVMFSLPVALIGVIVSLVITGRTFNITSYLGTIMLAGIVVNNAIVLVDYLNQLRARGMERRAAIVTAGETRLRPILMTSLTTILAMTPLALGIGDGTELQAPLATVVIGGLLFSTVLTLVVVPVMYEVIDDLGRRLNRRR